MTRLLGVRFLYRLAGSKAFVGSRRARESDAVGGSGGGGDIRKENTLKTNKNIVPSQAEIDNEPPVVRRRIGSVGVKRKGSTAVTRPNCRVSKGGGG